MKSLLCISSLCGLATASVAAAADSSPNTLLAEMDPSQVVSLLKDWKLDEFFAPQFSKDGVDGAMLARMTADDVEAEIRALRAESVARSWHWRKLFAEIDAHKLLEKEAARRQLATSSSSSDQSSGVHIKSDSAVVLLGANGDVGLHRAGEAELLVDSSVTIDGALRLMSGEEDGVDVGAAISSLQTGVSELNATVRAYASSSSSSGHGSDSAGWTHAASFGCSSVATSEAYGTQGDECWKLSDDDINALMCNSELKVEFYTTGDTLFVQLVDTDGSPRDFHYDPEPNGAKWRWVETLPWKGPCTHDSQLSQGHFFFFKTDTHYGDCVSSNYENSVFNSDSYQGFTNRDGATFFPMEGWDAHIQMFVRTVCE